MNKKNNPKSKGSVIPILVILGIILMRSAADDPERAAIFFGFIVVGVIIATVVTVAKKAAGKAGSAAKPQPVRTAAAHEKPVPAAKAAAERPHGFRHRDEIEAEEAVHCAHRRGKEKYIEQLGYYLKAGLIDREEYKVMKARYEKLDIPEDYH